MIGNMVDLMVTWNTPVEYPILGITQTLMQHVRLTDIGTDTLKPGILRI